MNTQYKQYTIEEFITDESFIAWCKQGTNNEEWTKLAQDEELKSRIAGAKAAILHLQSISSDNNSIDKASKNKLWERIDASTSAKIVQFNKKYFTYGIASIAACFLLFFTYNAIKGGISEKPDTHTILASAALENITLPDRSLVSVKQGSSLSYDNSSFTDHRTIHLKGHAFFKVEKGSPFNVVTDKGTVRVLGTSFDVIEDNNTFKVVCYTGKVEVSSEGKKVVLTPGEETDFGSSTLKKNAVLHGETPAYISGKLSFDQVQISEVVKIIEEEYRIKINADQDFLSKTYSGAMILDDIDNVLKSITWPYHLSYSKNGNEVTINKNEK